MNFNKVILGGRLTRDPQTKFLPSQTQLTEFGMCVNRKYKTAGGEDKEESCFVDVSAFGKMAEVIGQHFQKGKEILIEGRLKFDQWEDKQGGGKRSKLTVIADAFQFVGSKGDGEQQERPAAPAARKPASGQKVPQEMPYSDEKAFNDEDIPF